MLVVDDVKSLSLAGYVPGGSYLLGQRSIEDACPRTINVAAKEDLKVFGSGGASGGPLGLQFNMIFTCGEAGRSMFR